MDLGTCRNNLKASLYKTVEDCLSDIQLIWDNCKLFNHESSVAVSHQKIHKIAIKLDEATKKLVAASFPNIHSYGRRNSSLDAHKYEDLAELDEAEE